MYTIRRSTGNIVITDWNGKPIYSASPDAYLIYREGGADGTVQVEKVGDMPDEKLLRALVAAVKFPL